MPDPYADIRSRLDLEHIADAATVAATALRYVGHARIELTPGDMTRYPIVIVVPGKRWSRNGLADVADYDVALQHSAGHCYPWNPANVYVSPGYAAEKWTTNQIHTGVVMSEFLNALARELGE
jgi:hypothetical protein